MATAVIDPLRSWQIRQADTTLKDHVFKNYQTISYPDKWRNLPEIPNINEIQPRDENGRLLSDLSVYTQSEEFWNDYQGEESYVYNTRIPTNIIDGPWPSQDQYVGAHYQMLREDAIASLRRSVAEVSNHPNMANSDETCIYTHVGNRHA